MTALGLLTRYGLSAPGGTPPPGPGLPSDPDGIWLESLFLTGLSNNDAVPEWPDASSAQYDLESIDTDPLFKTSVTPSGAPVVRAAGASRLFGTSRWRDDSDEPLTYFLVAATTTDQTTRAVLGNTTGTAVNSTGLVHWYPYSSADESAFKGTRNGNDNGNLTFGSDLNDGAFRVFTVVYSPSSAGYRYASFVGKSPMPAPGVSSTPAAVNQPLCLLGEPTSTSRRFEGDIAAVLWYREALSDIDREAVVDYLTGRYITPAP